jgi:hypothetical protein
VRCVACDVRRDSKKISRRAINEGEGKGILRSADLISGKKTPGQKTGRKSGWS